MTESSIDTSVPHSARIWNYWLGGKDNYPADQEAGESYKSVFPDIEAFARASRDFLIRSIRYLAGECRIDQFLDVGAGLPTEYNTHEAAQGINPRSRVVYVDHDPLALRYFQSLIESSPEGAVDYVQADLADGRTVVQAAAGVLDLNKPVALILSDVMGHVEDGQEAQRCVRALADAMPEGSYLVLSHASDEDPVHVRAQEAYNSSGAVPYILRSSKEIAQFFDGLELVAPGLVKWPQWRPDAATPSGPLSAGYGAIALIK